MYFNSLEIHMCKRHSDEGSCDEEELTPLFEYQHNGTELKKGINTVFL